MKRSTPSGAHSGFSSMITSPSPPPPGDTTASVTVLPPSAEAGDTATPVHVRAAQWRGGRAASAAAVRGPTWQAVHMYVLVAHLQRRRQRAPGRCGGRCRARLGTSPGRMASQMPPHAGRRSSGWAAAARRPRPREPRERTWRSGKEVGGRNMGTPAPARYASCA